MTTWYRLVHPALRPEVNMAVDQHLFLEAEQGRLTRPVLRVYQWSVATLSLGFHQAHRRAVNRDRAAALGVEIVRRPTGGRAVLHDEELTYSVVAPLDPPFSANVQHNYDDLARALHLFSERIAPGSTIYKTPEAPDPVQRLGGAPCFASLSAAEIAAQKKKLIGSSQKVGKHAFLQHGSIPLKDTIDKLEAVTDTALPMRQYMTHLGELCALSGRPIPHTAQLVNHLFQAFSEVFQVDYTDYPDPQALPQVLDLAQSQFKNPEFTWRK